MITVTKLSDTLFEVFVDSETTTTHQVTLPESYYSKLTDGKVEPGVLIEKSFEFLLRREPNTSILLPIIWTTNLLFLIEINKIICCCIAVNIGK